MAVLDELGAAVSSVAEKAGASAVRVGGGWRGGSGVVIASGTVLTNAHNVRSDELTVTFADGREAEGKVTGIDVDGDLAVVSVDTGSSPAIEWSSTTAHIGTPVFAVTLNGGSGPRVTFGFVSSVARAFRGPRGRRILGSIEHTAPLVPGSSGSALVDTEWQAGRLEHESAWRRLLPGVAGRRIAALARGGTAARRECRAAAPGDRHRPVVGSGPDASRGGPARPRGRAGARGRRWQPRGTCGHCRRRSDRRSGWQGHPRAGRCLRRAGWRLSGPVDDASRSSAVRRT